MNHSLVQRVSPSAFEERYAKCPDPWNFTTSKYESERYRATMQALSSTAVKKALRYDPQFNRGYAARRRICMAST